MHDEVFQEDINTHNRDVNTKRLLLRLHNGDQNALDTLVEENMPLARSIVKHYLNRGCEYDDLLQLAVMGMIKAARRYDFSYDVKFSTYAVPMITGEIKRFLRDDGIIKISRSIKENSVKVARERAAFEVKNSREPTVSELCAACGLSREDVVQATEAGYGVASIYESVNEEGLELCDRLMDDTNIDRSETKLFVNELMGVLDETEKKIIVLRYFRDMTQTQVARAVGMSQVQVSRREKKILERLRQASGL